MTQPVAKRLSRPSDTASGVTLYDKQAQVSDGPVSSDYAETVASRVKCCGAFSADFCRCLGGAA